MSILTAKKTKSLPGRNIKRNVAHEVVSLDGMLTVEDWQEMPDTKPRYELIAGKLVQKKLKTLSQVAAAGEFLLQAANWGNRLGWNFLIEGVGVKLDSYNGVVPNLLGFSAHQKLAPQQNYVIAPFLAVDISASQTDTIQLRRKAHLYEIGSVQLYLIIDTGNRTLEVFRLDENQYGAPEVLGGKDIWQPQELPGLKLELKNLWMS